MGTHVLKFDIKSSGFLSALPFLLQLIVAVGGGKFTDYLLKREKLTIIQARKANTTNALTIPGCKANTLDIAPRYGGILYGISNTVANVPGFLAPQVAGWILDKENGSLGQWQLSFWVVAFVYMLGTIIYLAFGSADEQVWAAGKLSVNPDAVAAHEMKVLTSEEKRV